MSWNTSLLAGGFDHAAAEELVSRLRLAASRLDTSLAVRAGRARIAQDTWRGRRRAEFDHGLAALTHQASALLDDVQGAIIRVSRASDDAVEAALARSRAGDGQRP